MANGVRSSWEAFAANLRGRDQPGGFGDAGQRGEHATGQGPAPDEPEQQEEDQHFEGGGQEGPRTEVAQVEGAQEVGQARNEHTPRPSTQEEDPHRGQEQDTGEQEEARVAEGELEPRAQPGRPSHGRLRRRPALS